MDALYAGFNLVIEVLVVSSIQYRKSLPCPTTIRFNLVIEVLVVSSTNNRIRVKPVITRQFQSRNRGTCRFKLVM